MLEQELGIYDSYSFYIMTYDLNGTVKYINRNGESVIEIQSGKPSIAKFVDRYIKYGAKETLKIM